MKKLLYLIKGTIYAIVVEVLCFIPMYVSTKYDKHTLEAMFLLLIILVISAVAIDFVKAKNNQNLLFLIPIFVIHLLAIPGRINYLIYINKNDFGFLKDLDIYVLEFIVSAFIATVILYQIVFFLLNLFKKAKRKKVEPKPFAHKWIIKSILFAVIADLSLYASIVCSNGNFNLLIVSIPILLLPAFLYSFFKSDSDHPLMYNLIVFGTHIVLTFFRFYFIASLNEKIQFANYGLDPIWGAGMLVVSIEAILLIPLIVDTLTILVNKLLKRGSL